MKRLCSNLVIASVLLISFNLCPKFCQAQFGDPEDPGGDPDAPIDGGVSLLIAAGVGYGFKKANDYRKKNKTVDWDSNK
jgi:hypothetical protein